jgi:hypothetical protein
MMVVSTRTSSMLTSARFCRGEGTSVQTGLPGETQKGVSQKTVSLRSPAVAPRG